MADLEWFESVPSGLRWFCMDCGAFVTGLGELDEDEARARMAHQGGCRSAARRAVRQGGEAER